MGKRIGFNRPCTPSYLLSLVVSNEGKAYVEMSRCRNDKSLEYLLDHLLDHLLERLLEFLAATSRSISEILHRFMFDILVTNAVWLVTYI